MTQLRLAGVVASWPAKPVARAWRYLEGQFVAVIILLSLLAFLLCWWLFVREGKHVRRKQNELPKLGCLERVEAMTDKE